MVEAICVADNPVSLHNSFSHWETHLEARADYSDGGGMTFENSKEVIISQIRGMNSQQQRTGLWIKICLSTILIDLAWLC